MTYSNLNTVRCEALFASNMQGSEDTDRKRVRATIMATVSAFGSRGCAARVAQEFGDHPDTAIPRMRWARTVISMVYGMDRGGPALVAPPVIRSPAAVRAQLSEGYYVATAPIW